MAPLNQDEQARVDRYNELQRDFDNGSTYVNKGQLEQSRTLAGYAERNAESRERFKAQREVEKKAENDRIQARRDAEVLAAQEAYKRVARVTFPGTEEQFNAAWPDILKDWQIRNTAQSQSALLDQKRQQLCETF